MKWGAGPHRPNKKKNRQLAAILILICIILIVAILMQPSDAGQAVIFSDRYFQHTVRGGETLYSISKRLYPDKDWRMVVHEITVVNGITPVIHPGQIIYIPDYGGQ